MKRVKDSGARESVGGGMVREPSTGRVNYLLALDGPMFERFATLLTVAATTKYAPRNWMLIANASRDEQRAMAERCRESAMRHLVQWLRGDTDEDHAAAVFFNINVHEFIAGLMNTETPHG